MKIFRNLTTAIMELQIIGQWGEMDCFSAKTQIVASSSQIYPLLTPLFRK